MILEFPLQCSVGPWPYSVSCFSDVSKNAVLSCVVGPNWEIQELWGGLWGGSGGSAVLLFLGFVCIIGPCRFQCIIGPCKCRPSRVFQCFSSPVLLVLGFSDEGL